ncbi:hypothetical protein D3C73_1190900 [compost metagenome]
MVNITTLLGNRQMRMPINQHITRIQHREVFRAIKMPMRQKEPLIIHQNLLPWRSYWKMQEHLIHFAIAITTYRNNT